MKVHSAAYGLQDLNGTSPAKANNTTGPGNAGDKTLKQACKDFEAIFLGYLLKSMRKTVEKSDLMGSGQEEEIYQGMMDDEICKSASESNSIGIADALYNQLSAQLNFSNQSKSRGED
jgi:flagellar protein FlgJ